ncbi:MAG: hypothetical protein QXU06_03760 [Candidatus Bathyarchaeia archaeon]
MSEGKVPAIIKGHPGAIIEAWERKPDLLAGLMLRLAPWGRFAAKEGIRALLGFLEERFEDMNKRFEDLGHYADKRVGLAEGILGGFNAPMPAAVLAMLQKAFLG